MSEREVVSKYFTTKRGMDGSLSDFQDKRNNNTGPKKSKKNITSKKPFKRARGQKDIRVLIKNKESEIISYSKDFDTVCKKTGIDVDSEQLQLAIALSKSLHDTDSNVNTEPQYAEVLSSHQRTLKIKRSLQGYGFKILKGHIATDTNKRKKYKKQYKLLLVSQIERQQTISDKYAEVIAGNIYKSSVKILQQCENYDNELYYKATYITYDCIKKDDIYYVKDLFDKDCNKICLLRDWSDIPGRPLSPVIEVPNINFDDIICTQEEIDYILSGTIHTAQNLISNKLKTAGAKVNIKFPDKEIAHSESENTDTKLNSTVLDELNVNFKQRDNLNMEIKCNTNTLSISQQVRCISPDLFDDEVSSVLEHTNNNLQLSEQTVLKNQTYCMDLTQCINVASDNGNISPVQPIREVNKSKRITNDYMEITECVATCSGSEDVDRIDFRHIKNDLNRHTEKSFHCENSDVIDLTQIVDQDIPAIQISNEEKILKAATGFNNEFILSIQQDGENFTLHNTSKANIGDLCDNYECIAKKYSSDNYNKGLNCMHKVSCVDHKKGNNSFSSPCKIVETIALDDDDNISCLKSSERINLQNYTDLCEEVNNILQNGFDSNTHDEKNLQSLDKGSENDHSFNTQNKNTENAILPEGQSDEIDLTQSSGSLIGDAECGNISYQKTSECLNNLGKRDNISVDYDEIFDDIVSESKSQNSIKPLGVIDIAHEMEKESSCSNNDIQCNRVSEIFEISDQKFNYSLHQSKLEKFENIIYTNFENNNGSDCYVDTKNRSLSESNLTTENIKKHTVSTQSQKLHFDLDSSPTRMSIENIKNVLQTPKNCEYIIKTDEVTPMQDYASMSSPERNEELEKYGLKPFKRKRAIQLLQHIYMQTHPVVESHTEVCPSPSKKRKRDDGSAQYSPKKLSSSPIPRVCLTDNKKSNLYTVTKDQPNIRNIECDPEDWVFQKREKVKMHSCRVPLHVAFHNYVSCRRRLREAILQYEPVDIDFIHKELVGSGYKYNLKDLLRFMDKKCITVRTADNNTRNRKS